MKRLTRLCSVTKGNVITACAIRIPPELPIIFVLLIYRHDEWIGNERIIGHEKTAPRAVKQTRTRTIKEPAKGLKPTPKPTAKPVPKATAKKNGKNVSAHTGKPLSGKARKRTPSPTLNMIASSRNGNGRACKNRKDNSSEKTEPSSEGGISVLFKTNFIYDCFFHVYVLLS